MLDGLFLGHRLQDDGEGMITVHTQQDIGIKRNIFRTGLPFFTKALKIRKRRAPLIDHWPVDAGALP